MAGWRIWGPWGWFPWGLYEPWGGCRLIWGDGLSFCSITFLATNYPDIH